MFWLLFAVLPQDPLPTRFSCVELNHFYDNAGALVFPQIILWEGNARYYKCHPQPLSIHHHGPYLRITFRDDTGTLRQVETSSYLETWTQYDPEVEDRLNLPLEFRAPWP